MSEDGIARFINEQVQIGTSLDNIKAQLIDKGWNAQQIDQAIGTALYQAVHKPSLGHRIIIGLLWSTGIAVALMMIAGVIISFTLIKTFKNATTTDPKLQHDFIVIDTLVTQSKLVDYRVANGHYPTTLDQIGPDAPRQNAVTQKPYQYKVDTDGLGYQLCTDDSGSPGAGIKCATATSTLDGQPLTNN